MKKTGLLLIVFVLFITCFSFGQTKITPLKSQRRVATTTLKSSNIIGEYAVAPKVSITPGNWVASTGTDFNFDFVVNDNATKITTVETKYNEWSCGSVTISGGVTYGATWGIDNGKFTIELKDSNSNKETTITGTFGSNGTQASGNWVYKSNYGECSGTWTAVPEGGGSSLPDLEGGITSFSPKTGSTGALLNIQAIVKNVGEGDADTSTVGFYLVIDPNDISKDIFIGSAKVQDLKANEEVDVEISYEIASSVPEGKYYIGYTLDLYENVEESNEGNDFYSVDSQFERLADPELIVSSKISDLTMYINGNDFNIDLEAPPAIFSSSNPNNALSYSVGISVNEIANVSISGSVLTVQALSVGKAIITVNANDGLGNYVLTDFEVEVKNEPSGAPWWGCLILNGSGDYAEALDHDELDLGDEIGESITVEAWINFTEFRGTDIIGKSGAYWLYAYAETSIGYQFRTLGFDIKSGNTYTTVAVGMTSGGLWKEGWHHVAGVYDKSSGDMSLYLDGEQLSERHEGDIVVNNSNQALRVGNNFNGMIDEVRISDCARYKWKNRLN